MFDIQCDKCGSSLYIDQEATMKFYLENSNDYRLFNDGIIDESTIHDSVIFTCIKCKEQYKFNYRDWESRYRRDLVFNALSIKKYEAFKNLNPAIVKETSDIEFCGQCFGSENNGYCLVDIIKQCVIRN